jgi:flagellar hook protein FlgE
MALQALFVGSTGLQANSSALDVIGSNLANTNTTGYKSQRVQFNDLVYQTLNPGSGPSANFGGVNPAQLGGGVEIGAIGSNLGQGGITTTGRPLDMAIAGQGFFTLSNGAQTVYSRAGAFDVDAAGFLVDPATGFRVQRFGNLGESAPGVAGFQQVGNLDIRVPFGAGLPGVTTANVQYQGNLSAATPVGGTFSTAIQVFDTQSTSHSLNLTFTKTAADTWDVSATISGGTVALGATQVTFDSNGLLVSPASIAATLGGLPGAQTVNLNLGTPGQSTGLTQFGSTSTAAAVTQDGTGSGVLNSVSVDATGVLQGVFSNGRTVPLAQLAIANFNNPGGLLRSGDNYFVSSGSSGEAIVGPGGSGGRGTIQGAALEGSNVDIAIEFSRLIIAQRGFQVNARTVTAANEVLQELASIIR